MSSAKTEPPETPYRIEPLWLEDIPTRLADSVADLKAEALGLGRGLHPQTLASLADLVRSMNCYYSNLIEGHNTRPRDIERVLKGDWDEDEERRDLQAEALAHIRVQREIDRRAADDELAEPAGRVFLKWVHKAFYEDAPQSALVFEQEGRTLIMTPGQWRSGSDQDVAVGRHIPPSGDRVETFMKHFEERYRLKGLGSATQILRLAAAHHRFNYIHPFLDGNGRVSRLMSHAMAHVAGIGAGGLWSISRGLARGLESRSDYKAMMDHADMQRQGSRDGRGNLSLAALEDYSKWFVEVCLDQVRFMSTLFDLASLEKRFRVLVERHEVLRPEAALLLCEALIRGEIERGAAARITGMPERTARRVLNETLAHGLLASETPKGPVSLRFPERFLETLFPRLYPET